MVCRVVDAIAGVDQAGHCVRCLVCSAETVLPVI